MDRRTLLKAVAGAGTLAVTGKLSAPALAQGAALCEQAANETRRLIAELDAELRGSEDSQP